MSEADQDGRAGGAFVTTPGGVPNLPAGALTLDDLASKVQDMSGDAMKGRAVARMPSVFNSSTGLNPALDFTPFGLVTRIYAEVMSLVANADPADINGPDDLPQLVKDFIEGIPLVGQFVALLDAILGDYDGDDQVLLAVREIFAPIRAFMQMFAGLTDGIPTVDEITAGVGEFLGAFAGLDLTNPGAVTAAIDQVKNALGGLFQQIVDRIFGGLTSGVSIGNPLESLELVFQQLNAAVTQAVNSATAAFGIVTQFGSFLHQQVGGLPDAPNYVDADDFLEQIGAVSGQLVDTAFGAAANVLAGFAGIFNAWFGGTAAAGTPQEAIATVESIRVLTKDGYTVQTFVTSNPTWTVPPELVAAEVGWAGVIGGGGKGSQGFYNVSNVLSLGFGGAGGVDGGYALARFDPKMLPATLPITIGTAATVNGASGSQSSIGALVTSTPGISGISTPEGYQASTSKPGRGGKGGDGWMIQSNPGPSTDGERGEASATAPGGAPGVANTGNGGNGSPGSTTALPIAGGGGGGGGGGRSGFAAGGFNGGNGGFPGGGSGGGGGVASNGGANTGGSGGIPANGFAFLIWK